jgi:hypothetical protein
MTVTDRIDRRRIDATSVNTPSSIFGAGGV